MGFINFRAFRALQSGIRRRWLVNSLGITSVVVIMSITVSVLLISNYYYESIRATLESSAIRTSSFYEKYYVSENYDTFFSNAKAWVAGFEDKDKLELQFIGLSGRVEITSFGPSANFRPQTSDVREALDTGRISTFADVDPLTGERIMSVSAPLTFGGTTIGVMRFISSLREADKRILQSFGLAVLIGLAALGFVTVLNILFIRGIVRPLQEINQVTKRIAAGSYGARIETVYDDEIGELADNINHMSSEINISNRMRTDFMSSVSHELRTPLTAISGWGETLLSPDFDDLGELKNGIRVMLKEATRLNRLVEELLDFARMEGGRMTLYSEPMDLTAELDEVVTMMAEGFRKDGINVTYEKEADLPPIIGDKARLKQVFFNILDNAAKHGREGKRIDISVVADRDEDGCDLLVNIRDFGQGIPADELPHVKMRFYKGATRTRGNGIGLSVSDEIINLHNGTLEIDSTVGEGTAVVIRLPAQG